MLHLLLAMSDFRSMAVSTLLTPLEFMKPTIFVLLAFLWVAGCDSHPSNSLSQSTPTANPPVGLSEIQLQQQFAEQVRICDTRVGEYESQEAAQKAYATLLLSGLHDAVIHPLGQKSSKDIPTSYELRVPSKAAIAARNALEKTQIVELKRFADRETVQAANLTGILGKHRIPSALRPVKDPGTNYAVVYVRRSDQEAARELIPMMPGAGK